MQRLLIILLAVLPLTLSAEGLVEGTGDVVKGVGKGFGEAASSTGEFISDSAITSAVKSKIAAEMGDLLNISVSTIDGTVYLSGQVSSKDQQQQVVKISQSVGGVKEVKYSQLEVK